MRSPFCACPLNAPCESCRFGIHDEAAARADRMATMEYRVRCRHAAALENRQLLSYYATWPEVAALLRTIDEMRGQRLT